VGVIRKGFAQQSRGMPAPPPFPNPSPQGKGTVMLPPPLRGEGWGGGDQKAPLSTISRHARLATLP
jgi:hypothetical protein